MFSDETNTKALYFGAIRRLRLLFKFMLEMLAEIKAEHEISVKKLNLTLVDIERFVKEKHGIDIQLNQMVRHADFLDEEKAKLYRKRILDYGNALVRELDEEYNNEKF